MQCVDTDLGSTSPLSVSSTTVGKGNDAAPSDGCFALGVMPSNGEDVLYRWTAPSNGTFVFNTLSSPTDTILYLWTQCSGPELVCNDDFDPDLGDGIYSTTSQVGLEMTMGQQVIVAVDSYSTSGPFTLDIAGPVAAGNCCAQRSTPGCANAAIAACVCNDADTYCCNTAWDRTCVEEAISLCSVSCN